MIDAILNGAKAEDKDMPAFAEKGIDESAITILKDEYFQWPREQELYEPPHLLIKEHESLPFVYREDYLTFKHKIVGISCPQQAAPELRKIANFFKKHHRSLRFMVAFSSQYLVNRQAAFLKVDIDRFPYPENPDDFNFVELEKVLRDDVLDYQVDYITQKRHLMGPKREMRLLCGLLSASSSHCAPLDW